MGGGEGERFSADAIGQPMKTKWRHYEIDLTLNSLRDGGGGGGGKGWGRKGRKGRKGREGRKGRKRGRRGREEKHEGEG